MLSSALPSPVTPHLGWACALAIVALLGGGCNCGESTESGKPSSASSSALEPGLVKLLAYYDARYDAESKMLVTRYRSPGYHTRLKTGATVHPTRDSLFYALALLQRNEPGDNQQAAAMVQAVLALQDQQAASPTRGVWPYLLEEPLAAMATPDLNWADFCGAQLVHMLIAHQTQLPTKLRAEMRHSVRLAAEAIRRRNVGPAYSNIAVLGGGVCAAAGELLRDNRLLAYGRARLQGVVQHTAQHHGFTEYNSPSYLKVVIAECERTLQLVRDPPTRAAAETLRRTAWRIVSESFHPATAQWAGPHARTSRDRLRSSTVEFLSRRVGATLPTHPTMQDEEPRGYAVVRPIACPQPWRARFTADSASEPRELRRIFERGSLSSDDLVGVTWLDRDACLGSVSRSELWTQRKPLIGYWRTPEDAAIMFRLRFLHDGRDFASMGVRTAQRQQRVLALVGPLSGKGDWHLRLDRPPEGKFVAKDFRLRLELRGHGAHGEKLADGRFALIAGQRRIVLHPTSSSFAGQKVAWELGEQPDHCYLDGVCYAGPEQSFAWPELTAELAIGIELLTTQQTPTAEPLHWQTSPDGHDAVSWNLPAPTGRLVVEKEE